MTLEGAALIAQIIPVLLLVIIVERRAVVRIPQPSKQQRRARARWTVRVLGTSLGFLAAVLTEVSTVLAVVEGREPTPSAGTALFIGFFITLLMANNTFIELLTAVYPRSDRRRHSAPTLIEQQIEQMHPTHRQTQRGRTRVRRIAGIDRLSARKRRR